MTTLICTGALFSDWELICKQLLQTNYSHHPVFTELSKLSTNMFQNQLLESKQMYWKPFPPNAEVSQDARMLLSSIRPEQQFIWADSNSCLALDFWQEASEDVSFVLFYSSPEFELSKYIKENSYDPIEVKSVLDAWNTRTRSMLTFFMQFRNKCLLVDVQDAMRTPEKLVQKINEVLNTVLAEPCSKSTKFPKDLILHEYFAATLVSNNDKVSELFDEVRSTATVLDEYIPKLTDIHTRTELLIPGFLKNIDQMDQLKNSLAIAEDEINMMNLQIHEIQKELEFYYKKEKETAALNAEYLKFLNQDPALKLARLARQGAFPD